MSVKSELKKLIQQSQGATGVVIEMTAHELESLPLVELQHLYKQIIDGGRVVITDAVEHPAFDIPDDASTDDIYRAAVLGK